MHRAPATLVIALLALLAACGTPTPSPDAADARADAAPASDAAPLPCPERWVPTALGGCAPALIVCATDAAAPGACDGVDLSRSEPLPDPAGGPPGATLFRQPDGAIGGAWSALESSGDAGPPPPSFRPDAGIFSCPPDWTRAADGTCDPTLRSDCPAGSEPVPGGVCTQTSEASCAPGEYPDVGAEIGGAPVAYVRAGADPARADGTAANPDPNVTAAIARVGPGGWVLVAAGTYVESLAIAIGVHVVGVCAARVRLAPTVQVPAVTAAGAGTALDLRGVTLAPSGPGVLARDGAQTQLRGVRIESARGYGVRAEGARSNVALRDAVVRDTREDAALGAGRGLDVDGPSTITAERVALVRNTTHGAFARGAVAQLGLTACTVRETRAGKAPAREPAGVRAEGGALLTLARTLVADSGGDGVVAVGAGTMGLVAASVVAGALRDAIASREGASLRAFRTLLAGYARGGAATETAGSSLLLEDSRVRSAGDGAAALYARDGTLNALRTVLPVNPGTGVDARGVRAAVGVTECVIEPEPGGAGSEPRYHAVDAREGAVVAVARSAVRGALGAGVFAQGADTRAVVADSVLRETRMVGASGSGAALFARDGARIEANRARVEGSGSAAARAVAGAQVALDECVLDRAAGWYVLEAFTGARVAATRAVVTGGGVWADGAGSALAISDARVNARATARGMVASAGATLAATRVVVASAREAGVYVHAAVGVLRDVVIEQVQGSALGFGAGVLVAGSQRVRLERVAVLECAAAGVLVTAGGGAPPVASTVEGDGVFVQRVVPSTVALGEMGGAPEQRGPAVAHGVSVALSARVELANVLLTGAEYGAASAGGAVALRGGAIAECTRAAGAYRDDGRAITLERVALLRNARDAIALDPVLPVAMPPPPDRVGCQDPYCP